MFLHLLADWILILTKPVIVFMHGSGLTHIVWSLHEQFLTTAGYSVLSVDLPGHGNSEGPAIKSIEGNI